MCRTNTLIGSLLTNCCSKVTATQKVSDHARSRMTDICLSWFRLLLVFKRAVWRLLVVNLCLWQVQVIWEEIIPAKTKGSCRNHPSLFHSCSWRNLQEQSQNVPSLKCLRARNLTVAPKIQRFFSLKWKFSRNIFPFVSLCFLQTVQCSVLSICTLAVIKMSNIHQFQPKNVQVWCVFLFIMKEEECVGLNWNADFFVFFLFTNLNIKLKPKQSFVYHFIHSNLYFDPMEATFNQQKLQNVTDETESPEFEDRKWNHDQKKKTIMDQKWIYEKGILKIKSWGWGYLPTGTNKGTQAQATRSCDLTHLCHNLTFISLSFNFSLIVVTNF